MHRPLDLESIRVLAALHTHRDPARAASALGIRIDTLRRVLRRLQRTDRHVFADHGAGLSTTGLSLLAASRDYHRLLAGLAMPAHCRTRDMPTVRVAAIGSGYSGLVEELALGARPRLLSLIETTPRHALRLLDTAEVDAAYLWESEQDQPGRSHERRMIASERLMIAAAPPLAHRLGATPQVDQVVRLSWATTPSGLPLVRDLLRRLGVPDPQIRVVDCILMLAGLTHTGEYATLISPLTTTSSIVKLRPPIDITRELVLLCDTQALDDPGRTMLHADFCRAFQRLSQRRLGMLADGTAVHSPAHAHPPDLAVVPSDPPTTSEAPVPHPVSTEPTPATDGLTDDDLNQLRAIRERGSVNQAAKALLISQPALSRRIAKVEVKVGGDLLVRRSTGSGLSPLAERLLAQADAAQARFQRRLSMTPPPGRKVV